MGKLANCPDCGRGFSIIRLIWRKECGICHGTYCHSCLKIPDFEYLTKKPIKVVHYCSDCWDSKAKPVMSLYKKAVKAAENVEIFSKTYKGRIPSDSLVTPISLKTDWYRDRDEAEFVLKTDAAFMNCDIIFNASFEKGTDSERSDGGMGTYRFAVWRYAGKATKRVKG